MRIETIRIVENPQLLKQKLLAWSQQFKEVLWLEGNGQFDQYHSYDAALSVGSHTSITSSFENAFSKLKKYYSETNDWVFGYLSYDLKNDIEDLRSNNHDGLNFPDLYFFQPQKLFLLKGNTIKILYIKEFETDIAKDYKNILETIPTYQSGASDCNELKIKLRIFKDDYLRRVNLMLDHIYRGDIYEANFCQEFYAEHSTIDPHCTFHNLNNISAPPFAAYLKFDDNYLMGASPERYLKRIGNKVVSQPIKGTARRSDNRLEDEQLKKDLSVDQKELSENIMIVDMVRNDLSRTATKGSVAVEELCKVYTYEQVHQMISTITSQVEWETNSIDIIKSTFPMGSMTGAPKISAMKLIENLEVTKRGLYSGAIGYIAPNGDFDFNVVIRSILYNAQKKYISYSVGSAITAKSDPKKEYEECLIKAKAMRQVLEE